MGRDERLNRKRTVEKASAALDKTVECIAAVNNQARLFEAHERRFSQHEIDNNRRFTAQGAMIADVDKRLTEADVEILRIHEAFLQMPWYHRWAWALFGYVPTVEKRADVAAEIHGTADSRPPTADGARPIPVVTKSKAEIEQARLRNTTEWQQAEAIRGGGKTARAREAAERLLK